VLDLRDHPLEPQRGVYAEFRIAKGTPLAGGNFEYVQVTPEVRGFWTAFGTVLAARARLGRIDGDVPETERYYSGGVTSHRGFAARRLSPFDPVTGIVGGGAALAETSFELRHGLGAVYGFDVGGVAFVDGGDVTDTPSQLNIFNLHWATGVGLRYLSPIGPVGLDFAWRLNRTGPGEPEAGSHFNLSLAVGEAF
jgi:outer membrane protein assembly factor BamA